MTFSVPDSLVALMQEVQHSLTLSYQNNDMAVIQKDAVEHTQPISFFPIRHQVVATFFLGHTWGQ